MECWNLIVLCNVNFNMDYLKSTAMVLQSLTNPFFQYSNTPSLQSIICDVLTFLSTIGIINRAIP